MEASNDENVTETGRNNALNASVKPGPLENDNNATSEPCTPQQETPQAAAAASPHDRALQEAQNVLDATASLDGFNLLGVVANPRGGFPHQSVPSAVSRTPLNHESSASEAEAPSGISTLEDTMHSLELTVAQVTEQIDALNQVFDTWSRHYLGTYYEEDNVGLLDYMPPQGDVVGQLTELPQELAELNLASTQQYMDSCGLLAHSFSTRGKQATQAWNWKERSTAASSTSTNGVALTNESSEQDVMAQLDAEISDIFFQTQFDLTNRQTFCELLVHGGEDGDDGDNEVDIEATEHAANQDLADLPECLRVPTTNILKLPSPDSFTSQLDLVELALLQQVRSKSIAFFHETNRFAQLKNWIAGLVVEVQRVRQLLDSVSDKSVSAWELIPVLDQRRQDLVKLHKTLEAANDVIRAKSAISGLLSANDDLGAAEHIQYGRRLLTSHDKSEHSNGGDEHDYDDDEEEDQHLDKLQALSTLGDQFTQYETLVVANLGEELVEIFLDFGRLKRDNTQRVKDMLRGLDMCQAVPKIRRLYENRLLDVIRMTVRTTVGEFAEEADSSVKACVQSMTLERFLDCLDMLFDQTLDTVKSAVDVHEFCKEQGSSFADGGGDTSAAIVATSELASKSISELLRLRKEAHSLITLDEMKKLWDVCLAFALDLEDLYGKATGLRSALLAQAKAFVERKHESNMSALVAALDSERWSQCDVSAERQAALTRLCSGRAVTSIKTRQDETTEIEKSPEVDVEGVRYKVVWSALLLVEMVMTNIACATHFQSLGTNVVGKVAELLRLFNSRSTQLVLGAGAIHAAARLKSINAKHLSLVTQCLGMIIAIFPYIRASLMAQLPPKQHNLLNDLDTVKKDYAEHNEKVLNKFVTIIGGIVEHGLAPRISGTDFDARALRDATNGVTEITCCVFLDGVFTNTKKMHHVLNGLLPRDHLQDVFSRIFAYLDQKVPALFLQASVGGKEAKPTFSFPTSDNGKRRMLLEVEMMTNKLNELERVRPWEFSAIAVLGRKLEYVLNDREMPVPEDTTNDSLEGETQKNVAFNVETNGEMDVGGAASHEPATVDKETASDAEPKQLAAPENDTTDTENSSIENDSIDAETNGTRANDSTSPEKGADDDSGGNTSPSEKKTDGDPVKMNGTTQDALPLESKEAADEDI